MFDDDVPTIDPGQVAEQLEQGWALLDVRTPEEWALGRIPGSVHLPMDQIVERLDDVPAQVICVCAVGGRSARVAQYLNAYGREAVNLDGGLQRWAAEGRPVER